MNTYWGWSIPTITSGTPERLGAGGRDVAAVDPVTAAMAELLAGPNELEREIGMLSEIPAGTRLNAVEVSDGVAIVDLSDGFEGPGGSLSDVVRVGQVVFALTQFDEVERVRFRIAGVDADQVTGHGIVVGDGLTRDDLGEVRPFILVERPTPGDRVGPTFTIRGESNTFESNVRWTVVDDEGSILDEGFTTSLGGTLGVWAPFEVTVALTSGRTGRGGVIVFDTSPDDGRVVDAVEYPIRFDTDG